MLRSTRSPDRTPRNAPALDWRVRFAALAMIWGTSFWFIKIGVQALVPLQITLGRCAFGAAVVVAMVAVRREPLPRDPRTWVHLTVAAVLLNVIPFTLFGYAEQRIPSALAGICNAATPLFTVLLALTVLPEERPTRRRAAGLLIGFAGVVVVLGAWRGLDGPGQNLLGTLLALGAALCYGLGWVYVRRFLSGSRHSTFVLTGGQLIAATVLLSVLNVGLTDVPARLPVTVVLAIAALGALGTGTAYVLQYGLIRDAGATIASTVTYLAPIVAVLLGVTALGEHLDWNEPLGALVIIAGAVLVGGGARRARHTSTTASSRSALFTRRPP